MLVSVITPAYNAERFIGEAIESVISQTFQNWEMIIVDDGSTDSSPSIISQYAERDNRIRVIHKQQNAGPAEARNIALNKAKGRYIAFLDSDDLWVPEKLEIQLDFMQQKDIAFCFTAYKRISGVDGHYINTIHVPETITYKQYLKNTVIGTSTTVIDKMATGFFEMPIIRSSQDMALWCRFLRQGITGVGLNETLTIYRVVGDSHTANKFRAASDVWRVYRKFEKKGLLDSGYYFIYYIFNAVLKRIKFRTK